MRWELSGGRYLFNQSGKRTAYGDAMNRTRSSVRAMIEHPFHTIKHPWSFTNVRYWWLAKNTARVEIGRYRAISPSAEGIASGARDHTSAYRRSLTRIFSTPPAIST